MGDNVSICHNTVRAAPLEKMPNYWIDAPARFIGYSGAENSSWKIQNNLFVNDAPRRPAIFVHLGSASQAPLNLNASHNAIFNADSANVDLDSAGFSLGSLYRFAPLFAAEGDNPFEFFALTAPSPAIDKGIELPAINDGFAGAAPDIGAVEFLSIPTMVRENLMTPVSHPMHLYNRAYDLRGRLVVSGKTHLGTAKQAAASLIWVNGQGNGKKGLVLR